MIACRDADVLAAALSVGSLDREEVASLDHHLAGCTECRARLAEYMAAAARLPVALEPLRPSPELRGRLMKAVYAEAGARRAEAPAHGWRRLWRLIPSGRGFTLLAAAAAAAIIALVPAGLIGRQTAPTAPVAVELTGTSGAPQVHGRLVYQPGGAALVSVSGLPAPARGGGGENVYELWLIKPDGQALPAGYLSQSPNGDWTAALDTGVSGYAKLAATVEPPGGSRAPTGVMVVEGSLPGR